MRQENENWFQNHKRLLAGSVKEFRRSDPLVLASSIAFFTIFALPGVLVILVEVSALLFEDEKMKSALVEQAGGLMGNGLAEFLYDVVQDAGVDDSSMWDRVFGIAAVIISATMAFMALQRGLNKIWGVRIQQDQGFKQHMVTRGISLLLLAGFSFMLPVALLFDNLVVFFFRQLDGGLPSNAFVRVVGQISSLLMLVTVLAVLFKVLPNAKVYWGDVWAGAFVAGVLFAVGRYVIGLYINAAGIGEAFGAGKMVLVVLVWMFMAANFILFGATHCNTVAEGRGHGIEPGRQAHQVDGGGDVG